MATPHFPDLEKEVLRYWDQNQVFTSSLQKDAPKGDFVFYEGPPTANGKPGIHHVLSRTFKDIIPRYKTMQGYHVTRKAGWDTHGLPVELQVEKKLGISSKQAIENIIQGDTKASIIEFNKLCKESVWQFQKDWEEITKRMGYWLDLSDPYITYSSEYIESVWWILGTLWANDLLYHGYKVVPYCARCGTALSSHELAQGYKRVKDPSVYVTFPIKNVPASWAVDAVSFVVWTTTPWTLPGNVALAVNTEIDYGLVKSLDKYFIIAQNRIASVFGKEPYKTEKVVSGKDLLGLAYQSMYPYNEARITNVQDLYTVISADFVSVSEGSGIVHIAPAFGEDDYELGQKQGLPVIQTIDTAGKIVGTSLPGAGLFAKEADPIIIQDIQARGRLLKTELTEHDYPFCWRCDTPLLYYAMPSYFIAVTHIKDRLIVNNKSVHWVPEYIQNGRMGEWLENIKDWALSRDRYWGTPLPIWKTEDGKETFLGLTKEDARNETAIKDAIVSIREKMKKADGSVDYHRPFIDDCVLEYPKTGEQMRRVPEVIDVWFDSGAMPFAQYHYPFEKSDVNIARLHTTDATARDVILYPADYIAEAIDQTRGWFYTLQAIATLLGLESAYKNVITFAHVLDTQGKKMSKSKGNVVDPMEMGEKYGFDSIRWYFVTISQPGTPVRFDEQDVIKVQRRMFLTLWNVVAFFKIYEKADMTISGSNSGVSTKPEHILDSWIKALLADTVEKVTYDLEAYQLVTAARRIEKFVNDVSLWYVRRIRERCKNGEREPVQALEYVLLTLSKLIAPFIPFTAEAMWRELHQQESVHLAVWPTVNERWTNPELLVLMEEARNVVERALALRAQAKLKIRQPLRELVITKQLSAQLCKIIAEEVNLKLVSVASVLPSGGSWIEGEGVALNTLVDDELAKEGLMRELTRQMNDLRKKMGLTVHDKVRISYYTESELLKQAIAGYEDEIKRAIIATHITEGAGGEELDIDGEKICVTIQP